MALPQIVLAPKPIIMKVTTMHIDLVIDQTII